MTQAFIPNSAPWITEEELNAVTECLQEGKMASNEQNLEAARRALMQWVRGKDVLLTTSCTMALDMALRALHLQPGDEVLLPSYTFVSCANAILYAGGTPVFVDIEDRTLNMDLQDLEQKITSKTKAIMIVHYAGVSCDMDALLALAKKHNIVVIEDAAHAIGAKYKDQPLGTLGTFGCFSFHDTKNCVCGEGGAIVINDTSYQDTLEKMYEKGTNRKAFLRGDVDKYTWVTLGSSYTMSAVLAALLATQLKRLGDMNAKRGAIIDTYKTAFQPLVDAGGIRFPDIPAYASPNYHIAYFLMNDIERRNAFFSYMKGWGIGATFHYVPLHTSPYAQEHLGTKEGSLPVTEKMAASIVRLPLFPHMKPEDTEYIIDVTNKFFTGGNVIQSPTNTAYAKKDTASKGTLDFSLVLPCYREAGHLKPSLDDIIHTLDRLNLTYEIILIDDKSPDDTVERIKEYKTTHPNVDIRTIFHETNMGRGATVTQGIREAKGTYTGFLDIDLEVHARYIPAALLALQRGECDMIIADRSYKIAPLFWHRTLMTGTYKWMVRTILNTPAFDTEAGFKFFRRNAILPVLDQCADPHWFWDTEVSVKSYDNGLRIQSLPVLFLKNPDKKTTVKFFIDSWKSAKALLKFRRQRKASR